jgi:hypothetical protein
MIEIKVGDFLIQRMDDQDMKPGLLWLSKVDGEGMAVHEESFIKVLSEFYDKEF